LLLRSGKKKVAIFYKALPDAPKPGRGIGLARSASKL
jgi:hypothetical protein